jgi:hypothetical protein
MRNKALWIAIMGAAILTFGTCSGPIGDRHLRRVEEPLFRPASDEARARIADLFARVWREARADIDPADKQSIGYEAASEAAPAGSYVVLREKSERLEGRGTYFLRPGGLPVLLEAPHRNDDLLTGDIVASLFRDFAFAGAGLNSLSRWSVDDQARYGDLARRPDTVFTAFAGAFLTVHAGGTVVQIHGFDSEKRGEQSFATADVVISEGTGSSSLRIREHAACLDRLLPGRVLVYPDDTRELGGTFNATGELVRKRGAYFLHLELSFPLRRRFAADRDLAAGFAGCLLAGAAS